jgi:hypothetical protein
MAHSGFVELAQSLRTTAVLDGRLDSIFRERYPRFRLTSPALEIA